MQCIAPLRQTQLASSTRGLLRIARRRSRHSLKLTGAWREIALLPQARHGQDATRVAAHWKQRRKTRTSSALWGDIVERAGGFIRSREAGSRGRGGSRNQPHGLHVHRGEFVSHTVVDPRQLASDARMPTLQQTIYVSVGLLRRRNRQGIEHQHPRKPGAEVRVPFVSSRITCCVVPVPRVFAACCGTGRMLHLVWRLCRVAHWLSSTMLRTCC
jgi:hypothetical protein